jgi:hypothetical protein
VVNRAHATTLAHQRRFGVLCVLTYVLLSWAVQVDMRLGEHMASLVYPLDTFSMYAEAPSPTMSVLMVRDAQGAVHKVTDFRSFDCREPLSVGAGRCADGLTIQYHYEDLIRFVQNHAGPGEASVEIIMRTWQLADGAAPVQQSDCVISQCRVSR